MVNIFTISTANSNTNNYDVTTLRKKLEKVNKVLTAHAVSNELIHQLSPVQVKKLTKKREQYTQALLQKKNTNTNNHNNSDSNRNLSLSNPSNKRKKKKHKKSKKNNDDDVDVDDTVDDSAETSP